MTEENAAPDEGQAAETPWTAALSDDVRGYVENKGWSDPAAVVEGYRNLEKLRGVPEDRLLKLPEPDGDMSDVWARLGRPEAADGYSNALGDEFADDTFKAAAAKAHELGLNDAQFSGMQGWLKETTAAIETARREEVETAFAQWSQDNPTELQNTQRMLKAIGADDASVDAALQGDKAALFGMLARVAGRNAEGQAVEGDGSGGITMTPAQAGAKIDALFADPAFMERYQSSNARVRGPAIEQMERLHKIKAGQ